MTPEEIKTTLASLNHPISLVREDNAKCIIATLLSVMVTQQKTIDELTEKLNITPDNSSKPPSSELNKKKKTNKGNGKNKRGGQKGHPGTTRSLLPADQVDHIVTHGTQAQCPCGGQVVLNDHYRRHQVHDIPPMKTMVTEHQLFDGCCQSCGKNHSATLPGDVPRGMLGPVLIAFIATLTSDYRLSKRSVRRLLGDVYQLTIGLATIKRAEEAVSTAIKRPVEEATQFVQQASVVNADETSHQECGQRRWVWVATTQFVAIFMITSFRNTKAAKRLLSETFAGILGSDRYSAYNWVPASHRQVCWAYLKRDVTKIAERPGQSTGIGLRLLVYCRQMFRSWHQYREGHLTRRQLIDIMRPIQQGFESLLHKGTQCDHDKTRGTCKEILKVKAALWKFISHDGVEPTNNLSEQLLRHIVIWRKVCFGTWSENGTRYLERSTTVVATCRLQNRSVFGFFQDTMKAQLTGKQGPSLLPCRDALTHSKHENLKKAA